MGTPGTPPKRCYKARPGPQICIQKADYVLEQLESLCLSLADLPPRGHVPPELDRIGVTAYREIHFKPYRVIHQIADRDGDIHCVLDGRQDMQALLERRLLRTLQKHTPPAS
jgi:toxin ParE1/3/4